MFTVNNDLGDGAGDRLRCTARTFRSFRMPQLRVLAQVRLGWGLLSTVPTVPPRTHARPGGLVPVLSMQDVGRQNLGGGRSVPVRAFIASAALGSVSTVTRQFDLSVLVVDPPDRGGVTPYAERLSAALRDHPDFQLTDPRQGADTESLGRARIGALRMREHRRSRSPEEQRGLDGVEVHPGSFPRENIDFRAAHADVVVVHCARGPRSGVRNRAKAAKTPVLMPRPLPEEVERTGAGRAAPATIAMVSEFLDRRADPCSGRQKSAGFRDRLEHAGLPDGSLARARCGCGMEEMRHRARTRRMTS